MEKGTEIPRTDVKVGERYCYQPDLDPYFTFIVLKKGNKGFYEIFYTLDECGAYMEVSVNTIAMPVFANPMTELEKALL